VARRNDERGGEDEEVADERRVTRTSSPGAEQQHLAGEREHASDEPAPCGGTTAYGRRIQPGEDRQRREDHHPVQARRALLPDGVDDREHDEARGRGGGKEPSGGSGRRGRRPGRGG